MTPPRRERRVLLVAAAIVVAVAIVYLLVDTGFRTAPEDMPPSESPATEAPFGTEQPAPNQD
jgi:hypothetical protein